MAIVEFSVVPIGVGVSLSKYIARCMDIIDRSGLKYSFHPMGTIVEGDLDDILELSGNSGCKCYRKEEGKDIIKTGKYQTGHQRYH